MFLNAPKPADAARPGLKAGEGIWSLRERSISRCLRAGFSGRRLLLPGDLSLPGLLCFPGLLFLCGFLILQCAPEKPAANIVLITLDTTRADHLGCYGSSVAATPALDGFAEQAVVFENAVTTVPLTLPAHASILTGRTPPGHGIRNNASFVLEPRIETLAEVLSSRGYTTAAFVSSYVLHRQFGLSQGFQVYDDEMAGVERSAEETTRRAVGWLESSVRGPFFLWVHYFDPHTPWTPPEPFASATRGTPYDAEISSMDAGLGDLLSALRRLDLHDETHVVILADHGEGLGDHHEHEHGIFLYEECLRIPMLWKLPGSGRVGREAALVGVVDIVPTLLEFERLALPAGIEGASLGGLLSGGDPPQRPGLYAETMYPYYSYDWSPLYVWRTAELKYVEAPIPELYDLTRDPTEKRNLVSERAASASRLAGHLRGYRVDQGWDDALPAEGIIDPQVVEKLTSLGYVCSGRRDRGELPDTLPDPKDLIRYHEHFELGKQAAQELRFGDAVRELEVTLSAYPDNHAATYFMGLSLVKTQRAEEALVWLERHMRGAADPSALLVMGDALLQLDRPEEALGWFRKHLQAGPQQSAARERIGDALFQLGRFDEALEAYGRAASAGSATGVVRKRARVLVRLHHFVEAADLYAEGARAAPPEERILWDDWSSSARRLASFGLQHPAATADDLRAQVRAAATLALREEARALVEAARGEHPDPLLAALNGDVALAGRDWAVARKAYEQAQALGLRSADLFLRHAKACLETGDLDAGARVLRRGVQGVSDPGGLLHYNLACVLARQGEVSQSFEALEWALDHGYTDLESVRRDPDLTPLRDDPAFARLLSGGAKQRSEVRD